MKHRNTNYVMQQSHQYYQKAVSENLMQVNLRSRNGKNVTLQNSMEVVEYINCSYLGLDLHPKIIQASKGLDNSWGVNFCCARSRFSIELTYYLEEKLSQLYRGRAITFPSVTTTHLSVMPLLASGILLNQKHPPKVRLIFDKFAHSSMQFLKPILANEATVVTVAHNDLEILRKEVVAAKHAGETAVYVADGVYSMGGLCPINDLLKMSGELDFYIYLDDAHGTTIFGEKGEGSVLSQIEGDLPDNLFLTFCLSKGFGCNGGGVLLPTRVQESLVRTYGQIYAFSAALDFSIVNACLAAIDLHYDGTVKQLQQQLRERVHLYDRLMKVKASFSPIRMVMVGDEHKTIEMGKYLLHKGIFVSTVFFPIVPKDKTQLRICLAANHTEFQIIKLVDSIKQLKVIEVDSLNSLKVAC